MVDEAKDLPQLSPAGAAAAAQREARLAAALRANLSRRKAQARQRGDGDAAVEAGAETAGRAVDGN
jgi:hypothetical protein